MVTIIGYEERIYNGILYKFPILDYGNETLCMNCGRCCWNYREGINTVHDKCEHLDDDLKTCTIYLLDTHIKGKCSAIRTNWPQPYHFVDLPDDCAYVIYWKSNGMLEPKGEND